MKDPRFQYLLWILCLSVAGAFLGRAAAPALARMHYVVEVAERVYLEESQGLEERTLQSDAYRTIGVPKETLFEDAHAIRLRFRFGSTLFGLWCGLVAGFKIASLLSRRLGRDYVTDQSKCLSCGRCFLWCPVEHERLKQLGKEVGPGVT